AAKAALSPSWGCRSHLCVDAELVLLAGSRRHALLADEITRRGQCRMRASSHWRPASAVLSRAAFSLVSAARPVAAPDQLPDGAGVGSNGAERERGAVDGPVVGGRFVRSAPEAALLVAVVEDVVVDGTRDRDRRAAVDAEGVDDPAVPV